MDYKDAQIQALRIQRQETLLKLFIYMAEEWEINHDELDFFLTHLYKNDMEAEENIKNFIVFIRKSTQN
jgi:hypothetical protein